ncbi:MAG: FMN-binding protein [Rhodoluna sp.]|nr:FMN-binding protein [Rhodoluna sp.]
MHSSNPYTYRSIKSKRAGRKTTLLLSLGAVAAGIGLGILPNGGFSALFPATKASNTTSAQPTASGPATATGDAIDYQYGTIQVSVTRDSGKITTVDLVQAGANGGREQAFPILQQAAIDANGTSFGNVGGATFTTDAFKQALDSAIAKLP